MTDEEQGMTQAERQRLYYRRQREAGKVRMSVWIPDNGRREFWEAYDQLVARWRRTGQWRDS